jgi:hypothetical protein
MPLSIGPENKDRMRERERDRERERSMLPSFGLV